MTTFFFTLLKCVITDGEATVQTKYFDTGLTQVCVTIELWLTALFPRNYVYILLTSFSSYVVSKSNCCLDFIGEKNQKCFVFSKVHDFATRDWGFSVLNQDHDLYWTLNLPIHKNELLNHALVAIREYCREMRWNYISSKTYLLLQISI